MGSREENRQSVQGFKATEEVVRAAIRGSPSLCHPELVSGSALVKTGVAGSWLGVGQFKKGWLAVQWFTVHRGEPSPE